MADAPLRITLFGLGEAGGRFAADLAAGGAVVRAYDPAGVPTPPGVTRCATPAEAVDGSEVVLTLVAAADAPAAARQALGALAPGTLYADAGTGSATLKRALGATVEAAGLVFADVALMTIVPGNGLRTPALASGPGADRYAALLNAAGGVVESLGGEPGHAATRKLLRSVMVKGLAALIIEAMLAADAAGEPEWLWGNLVAEISGAGEAFMARLVHGTGQHALRRLHEMEACAELLADLGVDPVMTRATVETLRRRVDGAVPLPSLPRPTA